MRPALQRSSARPPANRLPRNGLERQVRLSYRNIWVSRKDYGEAASLQETAEEIRDNDALEQSERAACAPADDTQRSAPFRKLLSKGSDLVLSGRRRNEVWFIEGKGPTGSVRHVISHIQEQKQEGGQEVRIWSNMLEVVRERRRHFGVFGAREVYMKVIQDKLDMPTEGRVAAELWEHLIQLGNADPKFVPIIVEYAIRLRRRTGRVLRVLYVSILEQQISRSSLQALSLHRLLKTDFPPEPEDYESLFKISTHMGHEAFTAFEKIYRDHPVPDMYPIVVPELCRQNMRTEATRWHYILLEANDLPRSFHDCKALFEHYAHVKQDKEVEKLAISLGQKQVWFERDIETYVQNDKFVSREIMNRALGEVHNIAPKIISDGFCARLFATRLLSIDLVINGLQAMGLASLGPCSVREIVVRDGYECTQVIYHLRKAQNAGILLQPSKYNIMIEKAAVDGHSELLASIAATDLHPDTFEDMDLQERLLAMYCNKGDHAQVERTLAILESTVPGKSLKMQRANLFLRCYISLRNRPKVISILESMQRNQYLLAPRSSRHLRTAYLSSRRRGIPPSESGQELPNLILISNVMKMTLQAGASVPLESWKEILKRLGMMGHLDYYQNLALWLVGWYARLGASDPLLPLDSPEMRARGLRSLSYRHSSKSVVSSHAINRGSPLSSNSDAQIQNRDLLVLFGKEAQQGMIAWGFLAEVRRRPNLPCPRKVRLHPCHWQWGLRLLKELQVRGVPVDKAAVARACKLRLAQLFNHSATSNKKANRRAKTINDSRSTLMANFRYSAFIKGMEDIWGRDLFDLEPGGSAVGDSVIHGRTKNSWRIIRYTNRFPK